MFGAMQCRSDLRIYLRRKPEVLFQRYKADRCLSALKLHRIPERGSRDWSTINEILDASFLAAIGFSVDAQRYVIPMLYGRETCSDRFDRS